MIMQGLLRTLRKLRKKSLSSRTRHYKYKILMIGVIKELKN